MIIHKWIFMGLFCLSLACNTDIPTQDNTASLISSTKINMMEVPDYISPNLKLNVLGKIEWGEHGFKESFCEVPPLGFSMFGEPAPTLKKRSNLFIYTFFQHPNALYFLDEQDKCIYKSTNYHTVELLCKLPEPPKQDKWFVIDIFVDENEDIYLIESIHRPSLGRDVNLLRKLDGSGNVLFDHELNIEYPTAENKISTQLLSFIPSYERALQMLVNDKNETHVATIDKATGEWDVVETVGFHTHQLFYHNSQYYTMHKYYVDEEPKRLFAPYRAKVHQQNYNNNNPQTVRYFTDIEGVDAKGNVYGGNAYGMMCMDIENKTKWTVEFQGVVIQNETVYTSIYDDETNKIGIFKNLYQPVCSFELPQALITKHGDIHYNLVNITASHDYIIGVQDKSGFISYTFDAEGNLLDDAEKLMTNKQFFNLQYSPTWSIQKDGRVIMGVQSKSSFYLLELSAIK